MYRRIYKKSRKMQNRKDGYRNFREKNELGVKKEDFCWKHRNPLKLMTLVHGSKGQIAYSASKGAVVALTKSMAKELAPYHIRVNALAPGMIQTERLQKTIKDVYKEKIPPIAMGRLGSPQEIAEGCLYFASESSSYITGQILVIGGGLTL